jgi:hypothetical protein
MLSYENPGFSYLPDFRVSTNMFLFPPVYGTHMRVLILSISQEIEGLLAFGSFDS